MFKKSLKFIAKDTAVYGLSGAISKFLAIFIVPLLTRTFSPAEFGVFDAVLSFTLTFSAVIVLGQDSAIARYINENAEDLDHKTRVASMGFLIQLFPFALFGIMYCFFQRELGAFLLSSDPEVLDYWSIAILAVPGSVLFLFSINIFKWTFQRWKYVFIAVGNVLFTVVTTVYLVLVLHWGVKGAILPVVAGNTLFGLLGLLMNLSNIRLSSKYFDKTLIKQMLAYGIPFTIVNVAGALLPSIDRVFLVRYSSFAEIGSYAIGIKIASLLGFLVTSFEIAFGPYAFSIWKREDAPELFSRIVSAYTLVTVLFAVGIAAFGSVLMNVFATPEYGLGTVVLPMLLLAAIAKGMLSFTLLGIYWSARTVLNGWVAFIGITSSFLFNFLLIPLLSIVGAATALLLSNIAMNLVAGYVSIKYYPLHTPWVTILKIIGCAIPTFILSSTEFFYNHPALVFGKYFSIVVFPLLCWYFVIKEDEKIFVRNSVSSFLKKYSGS